MEINGKKRLTLEQIKKFRAILDSQEAELKEAKRAEVKTKIEALLAEHGFKIEDIYPRLASTKQRKKIVKYVNREDRSQTWSGMGRKPLWVIEHMAAGGRLDDLAV